MTSKNKIQHGFILSLVILAFFSRGFTAFFFFIFVKSQDIEGKINFIKFEKNSLVVQCSSIMIYTNIQRRASQRK